MSGTNAIVKNNTFNYLFSCIIVIKVHFGGRKLKEVVINTLKEFRTNQKFNSIASNIFNIIGVKKKVKGTGNLLSYTGAYLKNVTVDIQGNNNSITIEPFSKLENCKVVIRGSNHRLHLSKSHLTNTIFSFVQDGGSILVGEGTTMGQVIFLSGEGKTIKVGNDCMFSSGIEIRTTDSHSIISLETNKRINYGEDILIGNHVWIGKDARIWKGANIGNDSIIAFNSIVSKHIPDNSIAKGSPAKVTEGLKVTWDRRLIE
jgi:acetyltransferase-like isoleucine patch superfamily enzyme